MSIRQKRTMTEKSLEAHRRNARQSRGPVTAEGKKRLRDANISHGFYAQDGGAALVVLGEDPREYQALAEAVAEKWQPADAYEEQLSTQLVRALWRTRRSDRMQEGLALRLAQEAERWRQDNLHARLTKLRLNAACLRSLARAAGQPDYATTPADVEMLKSFQADGVLKDMGTVIMDLLIVLRPQADRGPFSRNPGQAPYFLFLIMPERSLCLRINRKYGAHPASRGDGTDVSWFLLVGAHPCAPCWQRQGLPVRPRNQLWKGSRMNFSSAFSVRQ